MSSLTTEARERKQGLRGLLKVIVTTKTALGVAERLVRRLISRKRDLPTVADLARIVAAVTMLDTKVNAAVAFIDTLRKIFQF